MSASRSSSRVTGRTLELERVTIPAGSFSMGSWHGRDDERPLHRVFVSRFEMAVTPVTHRAYAIYLEATGAPPPRWWDDPRFNGPRHPVVGVNWFEACAYCEWLSAESGLDVRLPTEAEREKAARGDREGLLFPWGNDRAGGGHQTLLGPLPGPDEVATLPPNGYGLFNMADTVHEWCLDGYHPRYDELADTRDPCAPGDVPRRVARGGSWRHRIVVTPCAGRSSLPPELHYSDFGFRWVRVES